MWHKMHELQKDMSFDGIVSLTYFMLYNSLFHALQLVVANEISGTRKKDAGQGERAEASGVWQLSFFPPSPLAVRPHQLI